MALPQVTQVARRERALDSAEQEISQLASETDHRQRGTQFCRPRSTTVGSMALQQLPDGEVLLRARDQTDRLRLRALTLIAQPHEREGQRVNGAHNRFIGDETGGREPVRQLRTHPRTGFLGGGEKHHASWVSPTADFRHRSVNEETGHARTGRTSDLERPAGGKLHRPDALVNSPFPAHQIGLRVRREIQACVVGVVRLRHALQCGIRPGHEQPPNTLNLRTHVR